MMQRSIEQSDQRSMRMYLGIIVNTTLGPRCGRDGEDKRYGSETILLVYDRTQRAHEDGLVQIARPDFHD